MLQIRRLKRSHVNEEMLEALNRLWLQLSPESEPLSLSRLKAIACQKFYYLVVYKDRSGPLKVVAMGSVHFVRDFPGLVGYVGNVVVDENYKNMGIGTKIEEYLVNLAQYKKAKFLEATTRSDRHAPEFWRKCGWTQKNTNVFRKYL